MRLVSGQKNLKTLRSDEVVCFSPVRNEALRIESFLNHHRSIGIKRFIFVDNSSDDGTPDYLGAQQDVSLFTTSDEFGKSDFGMNWIQPLLNEYRYESWALTLDADELFVYPHFENNTIKKLCDYLDAQKCAAVVAIMLDMYSKKSIKNTAHSPGTSLTDTCPYFDAGPYEIQRHRNVFPFIGFKGGARRRYFWNEDTEFIPPSITKVPLVKWNDRCRYSDIVHEMDPSPGVLSNISGALLHFKYLNDFHTRAIVESAREQHFANAREYKQYKKIMEENPDASLYYDKSVSYENSSSLLDRNIIKSEPEWDRLCGALSKFDRVSRNALCPCGSGKRYKHCHGEVF
jgi:glycosyltransferase involved in cell wall biosynthesis